jgi:hypothetical protein
MGLDGMRGSERAKSEQELSNILSNIVGERIIFETDGDTHSIDSDTLRFSFVLHDDSFEIRNIESTAPGVGSSVLEAVHHFCDEKDLDVFASNVKENVHGFWRSMGYEEGQDGDFFRTE